MEDRLEQLRLEPWFPDARDSITRPDLVLPVTQYFIQRWLPRLGPEAFSLIVWLRSEFARRGPIDPTTRFLELPAQSDLGKASGLGGEKVVRAALRRLEATGFLTRERRYRFDRQRGLTVHDPDRYLVALDDPVAPEDEAELLDIQAMRESLAAAQGAIAFPDASESTPPGDRGSESVTAKSAVTVGSVTAKRAGTGGVTAIRAVTVKPQSRCDFADSGSVPAISAVTNVNVQNLETNVGSESNRQKSSNASERDELVRRRVLVDDLVASLGDSGSRRFFVLVAARLPDQDVRIALSETIEARQSGALRRSAGAYFTDLVKRAATSRGVTLSKRARVVA